MLSLADRIEIVDLGNELFFVGDDILEITPYSKNVALILKKLKCGCDESEIDKLLSETEKMELLSFLKENDFLRIDCENKYINTIVEKQIHYLDDFNMDANKVQKNIENSTVAMIGVGGVGSVVIQNIIGAGVKNIFIIDNDCVNIDNFNRQFIYKSQDLKVMKIVAAKEYIKSIDDNINVDASNIMIESESDLKVLDGIKIDLLINAADKPHNLEEIINNYCTERNIPWITISVGRNYGTWGPLFIPNETMCWKCFASNEQKDMSELERKIIKELTQPIQASFGPINTTVSSLMSKDIILFLALKKDEKIHSINTRCAIDFNNLEIKKYTISEQGCSCWSKKS